MGITEAQKVKQSNRFFQAIEHSSVFQSAMHKAGAEMSFEPTEVPAYKASAKTVTGKD
jgi:hypothetical protein